MEVGPAVLLGEIGAAGIIDRPLAAAAATTFVMNRPFDFSVDPADLLDDAAPTGETTRAGTAERALWPVNKGPFLYRRR
ncbi:hypothetical protein [Micromonospora sp. NPDC051296]|uniref:hypothetical protein n=1 Tax=Micromonospora sp. NPDC051296 TaxID=3155046 RepID=UPI003417A803